MSAGALSCITCLRWQCMLGLKPELSIARLVGDTPVDREFVVVRQASHVVVPKKRLRSSTGSSWPAKDISANTVSQLQEQLHQTVPFVHVVNNIFPSGVFMPHGAAAWAHRVALVLDVAAGLQDACRLVAVVALGLLHVPLLRSSHDSAQ